VTCPPDLITPAGQGIVLQVAASSLTGVISGISWTLTSSPAGGGSTPGLWNPDPPTGTSETFTPYIVGKYTVHVTVTDSVGRMASCDTHVTALGHGLRVQLTWDGLGDVDLHLHNAVTTAPWFGSGPANADCFYADKTPQWDSTTTSTANSGNPQLDFDNTVGFGPGALNTPENTRIERPITGMPYTIGIHNYSDAMGRIATVRVFCGGVIVPTEIFISNPLAQTAMQGDCYNQFWKVASVTFTNTSSCTITPLNIYETGAASCAAF
jgi:hypothetical protein